MSEAIHQAARWLSEVWREPGDEQFRGGRQWLANHRYDQIVAALTRLAETKPPEHGKIGFGAPVYRGPGDLSSASVKVFDRGVAVGYLPDSDWPAFFWPPEEAERYRRKREAFEAQNPSRGASPSS